MGYDSKCYDLAASFLSDEPEINKLQNRDQLAQVIQDAIEDEIQTFRDWLAAKKAKEGQ